MSEEENEKITLDLSRKHLKKVPKHGDVQNVRILLLDENELHKIDNIDSYLKIEKLSLCKNQLLRMYGICRLHCLRDLNLSFNGILSIEGLKDCIHLCHLNLEGNNIKTIEHLNTNLKLEYLNLADNSIGSISDISFLKVLKELYLHGNRLTHLRQCDKYLPLSLEVLTLSKNSINDLNEICTLSHLINLHSISLNENPCVMMTAGTDGFDHRPFVLNWCMSLKVIDGYVVDPIESLKAEWLYSQGRGRSFRLGEQTTLAKYLSSVCPMSGKPLENENERKLRLILSKAQHHQRQLQEEISENSNQSTNNSPASARKKPISRIQSPRFTRISGRHGSPDSMTSSYHGNLSTNEQVNLNTSVQMMSTSLIENIKNADSGLGSISPDGCLAKGSSSQESTPRTLTPNPCTNNDQPSLMIIQQQRTNGPLNAASKMVPVPETLMSPDICPTAVAQHITITAINSHLQQSKLNKNKDNSSNLMKMSATHIKCDPECQSSPSMSPQMLASINNSQQRSTASTENINQGDEVAAFMGKPARQLISNSSMRVTVPDDHNLSDVDSSDEDIENISLDKLEAIRSKAAEKCKEIRSSCGKTNVSCSSNIEMAALMIQKIWRGYQCRKQTKDMAEKLLKKRTHEYIAKLTKDMELTKVQLENERKIQQLQMQAINALWKKVSSMQMGEARSIAKHGNASSENQLESNSSFMSLDNNSTDIVNDLTKTCSLLTTQVQQLQGSMRDILNCLSLFCNLPQEKIKRLFSIDFNDVLREEQRDSAATQTEIVAVRTPQTENFPFTKERPSTLPLLDSPKSKQTSLNCNHNVKAESTIYSPRKSKIVVDEISLSGEDQQTNMIEVDAFNRKLEETVKQSYNSNVNMTVTVTATTTSESG